MKLHQRSIFILIPLLFFSSRVLYSQSSAETTPNDSLRVGLVLSGGGAKGIAHIGVLKKLEEAGIRIDYITGTSIGSVIGALYSIGYTSDQLLEIAKSNLWMDLFTEKPSRRFISNYERFFYDRTIVSFPVRKRSLDLPFGIISGQNIYSFLSRYTWPVHGIDSFDDFPIPFATIATELETGEAKTFRSGYLPDVLRASISIPSLMRPHTINGVTYVDGGLSNNLPVKEAIEMGANFVIAVNVAAPLLPKDSLRTFPEVLNQVVNFRINEKIVSQIEKSDIYISPEKANAFDVIDFGRVNELVKIGLDEAELYMDQFRELAEKQKTAPPIRDGIGQYGSLPFNRVIINGNDLVSNEFILSELEIEQDFQLTPNFIDQKISQLYSTQLFDLITYQIHPDENGSYNLHINVEENQSDIFRIGIRYETQTDASILLSSQFRNLLFNSSLLLLELRLGDEVRIKGDLLNYGGLGSRIGVRTTALFQSENIDQFNGSERIARYNYNLTRFELSLGNYLSTNNLVAGGIRQNFIYHNNTINPNLIQSSEVNHQSYFLRFSRDNLHRHAYPTNGTRILANATYSGEFSFSNISFFTAAALVESFFDINNELTIRGLMFGGYSSGNDLPWQAFYSVNRRDPEFGWVRFGGFNRYELTSRNIQMASAGIQIEPVYHRFINLDYYIGRFISEWDLINDDIIHGASITVGALTIIGPIKAILSTSTEHRFLAEIQIGYQF